MFHINIIKQCVYMEWVDNYKEIGFSCMKFLFFISNPFISNRKNQKPAHGGRGRFCGDPVSKAWSRGERPLGWGERSGHVGRFAARQA